MKVAPFRALTHYILLVLQEGRIVEMEVAPFRALTQVNGCSVDCNPCRRNEGRPFQGIDTKKRNYISVLFVIVEMKLASLRA